MKQQQQQQQQQEECYSSSDTLFTCLFVYLFISHIYSSSFAVSLQPPRRIFHTFSFPSPIPSCSRLFNGCYTATFPSTVGKSKCSCALTKVSYFYGLEKPGMVGIPSRILGDTGTEIFKTYKTGTSGIPNCC